MERKKEITVTRNNELEKRKKETIGLDTFDVKLTASLGNIMYFIFLENVNSVDNDNEKIIKRGSVNAIIHETGQPTYLQVATEEGLILTAVQELFFTTYAEAEQALEIIRAIGTETNYADVEFEEFIRKAKIKYRYLLKFPIEPGDIILEEDSHYMAEGIHAEITFDIPEVHCYGKNNLKYIAGKRVLPISAILSMPLFEIKKL